MELNLFGTQEEDYLKDPFFSSDHPLFTEKQEFQPEAPDYNFTFSCTRDKNASEKDQEHLSPKWKKENKVIKLDKPAQNEDLKVQNELVKQSSTCRLLEMIKKEANIGKNTEDLSEKEESEVESNPSSEYLPCRKPKRKWKKRKDVIFKAILREWRRFYQIQVNNLTGFIISKRERNDSYLYNCMKKFNQEGLKRAGTFEENFYLAALLYPQDLKRNLDAFLDEKEWDDFELAKLEMLSTIEKIHNTLYKYSYDKLAFFTSKPEIAFLFCYYYEKGAGPDKEKEKFSEEFELIRQKCMDTLNK